MIGLGQPYTQIYDSERVTICLGALEPYDFDGLLEFFALRAKPGVESIVSGYSRTFSVDGVAGSFTVDKEGANLSFRIYAAPRIWLRSLSFPFGVFLMLMMYPKI